ncbi:hypothetical protein EUTSA_v10000751mg [Eutrema salsugineum]|uniref:ADP-ribosyl cyclase/cyclic ADP-ribose hydrolase n=1 Tax=Eutrema salsugineum TaxID=72664 RepID=V4N330_EUTSA|nr:disease resistance-like protein CSA1 [Eutrema salsugineum]ESQ39631.1 hypothetical protein EUTSA_v10000751mg [Eutrema salsugineum]
MVASSSANVNVGPQVFINFRGAELRKNFVSHLKDALERNGINAYIDSNEHAGEDLDILFRRIEESTVALTILSRRYTESHWCLGELVHIMKCVDRRTLWVIPIFYKLEPGTVKKLDGEFGVQLWNLWRKVGRDDRILKWDAALQGVAKKIALESEISRDEVAFLDKIIEEVQNALTKDLSLRELNPKPEESPNRATNIIKSGGQRLKQLEEKLDVECNDNDTRVVGIVGMAGIGKTYLAKNLFEKLKTKIGRHVFVEFPREKSNEQGLEWLQKTIVEGLLNQENIIFSNGSPLEVWKNRLLEKKVVVVLDGVSDKKHIDEVLRNRDWIKRGSKIVIITRDKSLFKGLECDLYEVPGLNDREGLELFRAQSCTTLEGKFMELLRKFLDYAGGNPLALKAYGGELKGKEEDQWEERLGTLTQILNPEIRKELKISYDELNSEQKDALLEIACFFRSQDEDYITTLLDSFHQESAKGSTEIRDLEEKFLIRVYDGRVEMQDLWLTMCKELVGTSEGKYWLFPSKIAESTDALKTKEGKEEVRGVTIDMSKMDEKPLDNQAFIGMSNLRYLKVYSSTDPSNGEAKCKLNLPDGLEFPEDNIIRYIYWMKFPGEELPSNFKPNNLIHLSLPYSKIKCVWQGTKVAPKLKWVDLSHSSNLSSLSGLSKAPNLLRLNLEGCISLKELPEEMKDMKNLVFLNLRECTSLSSLPDINMDSLKVLILSGCSKLQKFQVISEKLEKLYLNGTAVNTLPPTIGNLQRLILLNLKDCKNLVTLPNCIGKLISLQQLKLSRCSNLNSFPDVKDNMVNLRILLLGGTSITEMPCNIDGSSLSLLQRLCLSGNANIRTLELNTSHLKWLELKYCKNLTSLQLPPHLQCLDAHGCISLRTVTSSLVHPRPTENFHSTLMFTNCNELEQVSKNAIISYAHEKCRSMSDDGYNRDFVFNSLIGTCFPGCDVPLWFNHQTFGSILKRTLPRDLKEGRVNGVFLCVVVSFKEFKGQTNTLQVKCNCEFTDHAIIRLRRKISIIVGGCSELSSDESRKIDSDHVFIGYTNWFNTNKSQKNEDDKEYVPTEISLGFEVTDGASEVRECEVMKCGFSLLYNSEGAVSWEPRFDASPRSEESIHGELASHIASEHDFGDSNGLLNGE